jgi:hypothetical protein
MCGGESADGTCGHDSSSHPWAFKPLKRPRISTKPLDTTLPSPITPEETPHSVVADTYETTEGGGADKKVCRKFKCEYDGCERSFRSDGELEQHVDFKHLDEFHNVCDLLKANGEKCEYKFEKPGTLTRHKKNKHSDLRPFKCSVCTDTFKTPQGCKEHWAACCSPLDHPARTKYKCKVCQKGFPTAGYCNIHWVINCSPANHPARTKHKCKGCQKGFPTTKYRDIHYFYKCIPKDDPERLAFLEHINAYKKERYATDELYRLGRLVRVGLRRLMERMGLSKDTESAKLLGCSYEDFVIHLDDNDRGFEYGMEGVVLHIDHIRPMSNFNIGCRIELLKCCNWNNMQLLTEAENLEKGASFTPAQSEAYDKSTGGMAIAALEKGWRSSEVCNCELCV